MISFKPSQKATAPQQQGYFARVGADYAKAGQDIKTGISQGADAFASGIQKAGSSNIIDAAKGEASAVGGLLRSGLRTAGAVAGAAFSPITEAPVVKPALEAAGSAISKIPGIDVIVQKATELAAKHPNFAKDLQNIIDLATVGASPAVEKPLQSGVQNIAKKLDISAIDAVQKTKNTFAADLVSPVQTAKTKLAQVGRTTESGSLFKKDIVTPTALEQKAAKEVATIPGLSPKNTFQKNFNIVRDFNTAQAKQLEADIAKFDFSIPRKEVLSRLDAAKTELQASPLIVGDAQKTADKLLAKATSLVNENAGTGSGLLAARKQFDQWVLSQKPKVFDATSENALSIANKQIRDTFNTLLNEKAPNLGIKDSLQKQFALYHAMDNIAPKAAQEANTAFGRTLQNIGEKLGTRNKLVQTLAAATGIGVFGAAATYALPLTVASGLGFLAYRGGKLVMKPEVRTAISKLLSESSKAIPVADRVFLQNLLTQYQD